MLRIRINIILALVLASGGWACAPRSTPAPVIINGTGSVDFPISTGAGSRGSVIVQPGDTLYAISRYHKTALQALITANDLAPPYIIRPGQVLQLPGQSASPRPPAAGFTRQAVSIPPPPQEFYPPVQRKEIENTPPAFTEKAVTEKNVPPPVADSTPVDQMPDAGEDQTGSISMADSVADEKMPPLPPPAPVRKHTMEPEKIAKSPAGLSPVKYARFLWPATGPILSEFGPKQNGLHNDGINIAMPPNGPVAAAGDGVVSYAGNGLRGYGNLLLIQHDGGWVTAYAHNAQLLVKKGDRVTRGQVIARAGRSGGVSQDQLHFEVRQGVKAVDPKPLLVGG